MAWYHRFFRRFHRRPYDYHVPLSEWTKLHGGGVYLPCPRCGNHAVLHSAKHTIETTGHVNPSFVCPYGCGYHQFIRLVNWPERNANA